MEETLISGGRRKKAPLSASTKAKIALAVHRCMAFIDHIKPDMREIKMAYPFHVVFFSPEATLASRIERSVVTHLGMTFIPEVAKLVAQDRYKDVHRNHRIDGQIDAGSIAAIERVCGELRDRRRKPSHQAELEEVYSARNGRQQDAHVIADLYVGDCAGGPLFYEIKSPLPNLDVCHATKRKIFLFLMLLSKRHPQAYFALWYNPYIKRAAYQHNFTKQVMDMDEEVLLGREMWDKLGGPGAFDSLIEVVDQAADAYRKSKKS